MPLWKKLRILFCVVVCGVLLFRICGLHAYNVRTGSMAPEIPSGSLVVVVPAEPMALQKGDVAAYQANEYGRSVTVIHRVMENDLDDGELVFKGDANLDTDPVVAYDSVVGEMLFSVPYIGFLSGFLLGGAWIAALFCGGAAAWIFRWLLRNHRD